MGKLLQKVLWSAGLTTALVCADVFAEMPEPEAIKKDDTAIPAKPIVPPKQPPNTPEVKQEPGMGGNIKMFSEEVASRIDRIVKKKAFDLWGDPWTIQGVPIAFPSDSTGFNLGLRVAVQNIRRQDPHKAEIEAQVLASDGGRYKHFVKLDYPRILDGRFRLTTRASYSRDTSLRYYGIGNNTVSDDARVNNNDPFYKNVRSGPGFDFQLTRYIGRYVRVGPMLGLKWTDIIAPPGSLLLAEAPSGVAGGRTHYIGFALVHDTTDFEPYPSRGRVNEIFANWYAPFLGSEYHFFRFTYTFKQFIPMHRQLILGFRSLFETLSGNVPFYELGAVGGSQPTLGIGGDRFFRGYDNNRFMDKIRLSLGLELRWDAFTFDFAKQDVTLGFVPFIDFGRVWPTILPIRFKDWHASAGWGVRFIWNNRFVIRGDLAVNSERVQLFVDLGSSF